MDDILMVSLKCSTAASLWVEYFSSYFHQISKQANRKPLKIHHVFVEDFITASVDTTVTLEKSSGVKLQLVIVCPGFLDYISENSRNEEFGKIFLPDRTLALLLGVSDSDITDVHKKALPTYFKWQRLSVGQDQDENFTKEFISQAMTILSRVWKLQSSIATQEKSCFSISPKKIRQGQSTVFILLTYPLMKDDNIKISVEKNNEIREIKSVKRRNPYTIKISVPDSFVEVTAIINILVEKNGSIIGSRPIKCESKLRELEQILRSTNQPVEFMCQTLGFNQTDRENLDNWLVHNFQRSLPPRFNLLATHTTPFAATVQVHKHSYEEFPTLLHFAAKYGFEKLAMQLMDCPGADLAYEIRNVFDMTPVEIAEVNGHSELASGLKGHMNMNEFSKMYSKLKEISSATTSQDGVDHEYLTPKNLEDFYKICPAPRPVTLNLSLPSPSCSNELMNSNGYMSMHSPIKHFLLNIEEQNNSNVSSTILDETIKPKMHLDIPSPSIYKPQKNLELFQEDKVQKELLEIINDFKNNVHSISQVEKLVEEWKNRNDVQKSFKEKQEQLKEMRMRYEKIQHDMKIAMKKPSPFDRVKKLFSRSKSKEECNISSPIGSMSNNLNMQCPRPISSLSTSSSGSSGRMSTISGCSLGDSGTHSDMEERKLMLKNNGDDELKIDLNKILADIHYTPVPAPKPYKSYSNIKGKLSTTVEEAINNMSKVLTEADQYYIQFPPSGRPVTGIADKSIEESTGSCNEYMNFSANTRNGTMNAHDYMNCRAPSSMK